MNERILDRYLARNDETTTPVLDDGSLFEAFGCFGWLRGVRERAVMLELRLASGNIQCFGYPWLESAKFDPSEGIELQFGPKRVRVRGFNLNIEIRTGISLFSGIIRHRIPWIAVSDFAEQNGPRTRPFVESIEIL